MKEPCEKFDNFVHNELFLKIVLYICSKTPERAR